MREIKFRGLGAGGLGAGKWRYGFLMDIHNSLNIGEWQSIGGEATAKDELFISYRPVIPETIGQFTGLRDKNGREIYEEDRIDGNLYDRRLPIAGVVEYDDDHAFWGLKNDAGLTPLYKVAELEVIGNIHEHPELLEAK